jgi:hypothetical protein
MPLLGFVKKDIYGVVTLAEVDKGEHVGVEVEAIVGVRYRLTGYLSSHLFLHPLYCDCRILTELWSPSYSLHASI